MGELNFNTRQCLRALKKLGFTLSNKRRGQHDKFLAPPQVQKRLVGNQPRFIMVPRHGNLHCQSEILSELRKMGGDQMVEQFKQNL